MRIVTPLVTLALGALLVGATLIAQDQGMPPMPGAGAEHATLKNRVGTWDAAFKMHMGPQTVEDKASMTYKMMGDFWLVGDYEGHMMGGPFIGHEMATYDPETKQFVSCWFDSTSPAMSISRGTWDEATKTMTMTSMDKDMMTGKMVKNTSKTVVESADAFKFSMTPEGAPGPMMEIAYTRKK